jgi:heterodisulfide reductase subunit A
MYKKAAVIGGGIAGIQAALDLGEMGIETWLIEKGPSVGGRMAQLDKTFPTNDCAMCILSPKLVEVGSHPNVTILSNSEVIGLEGSVPALKLQVRKKPRYVVEEKCTGCGVCMSKCPIKIPDPYNKGLSLTKCIRIPFPQAVPAIPIMDREHCIYHQRGKCKICQKFCLADAIDFEQEEQLLELEVGSVVLACGSQEFDARLKGAYGYGVFPNVLTSIEYERILSASGPTGGHVKRPSDGRAPGRIAILQCVGSRDVKIGNDHCSAICCMQAAKDAIVTQEHLPQCRITVFYMDLRSYGKGFDRFVDRARDKHQTRFICSRISSVEVDPGTEDLIVQYITQDGRLEKEEFDLLVLSVGLEPSVSSQDAAVQTGTSMDERGFLEVNSFSPVCTSGRGIFACGSISGPKDIPESVMEASGAASAVGALLGGLQSSRKYIEYPPERDIRGEPPRVGVFVCRCGINIASTVDVPGVVDYISGLPRVKHAEELLFACALDSQKSIKTAIEEKGLNRMVICACTPRTHEPLFQKTLKEAGLNPYLFEFANIREQCSWVHQKEPDKATEKAKDLARQALVKVIPAEPLYKTTIEVNKGALIIGGGLAGMTAALDLAAQGFPVHMLEKEEVLGGNLRKLHRTLKGEATAEYLCSLIAKINDNELITICKGARIREISGYIGNFRTTLENPPMEIDHGVVIVASGAREYQPEEYFYGQNEGVVTQLQLEDMMISEDQTEVTDLQTVVMIQCVGSRNEERSYCSRVCCGQAIKNAIRLKEINPGISVYILFRDIRTYGLRERYYRLAREKGIQFVRFDTEEEPEVYQNGKTLGVKIKDRILNRSLNFSPDMIVLSTGIIPNPGNKILSQLLKVPLNEDGFFLEAHVKLRPVDFATEGIFVCGLAHYPKDIGEAIAQARAAAGRAATVLSKDTIETEGKVSTVREDYCSGCGACARVCAYSAIEIDPQKRVAVLNEALCKGCGACASTCRCSAIDLHGFRNEQILEALAVI